MVHEYNVGDRFINALAIRANRQGEGLGGLIPRSLLDDLSAGAWARRESAAAIARSRSELACW